jgi:hypothetical protein
MFSRRSSSYFVNITYLCLLVCLLLDWQGNSAQAADDQEQVGVWECTLKFHGSCPPDGLGRGPEDFWTYPKRKRKVGVSCVMTRSC